MPRRILAGFGANSDGNIAIVFAFSLVLLIGLIGFAVDYGDNVLMMTRLQTAADAAALDAVADAKSYIAAQNSQSPSVGRC